MKNMLQMEDGELSGNFPAKVKVFLWRAAHRVLPTKVNLLRRGVQGGVECGICKSDLETEWHSFVTCPFARSCWRVSGMENVIQSGMANSDSVSDLIFSLLSHVNDEVRVKTRMIMWQIWKDQNLFGRVFSLLLSCHVLLQ